jgi:nucleoside-diphosphate-sugar epimerase
VDCLSSVRADDFVLLSTVDVYAAPRGVDEDSPVSLEGLSAYGVHRHRLEEFVRARFDAHVLRLPIVFGEGLRKNAIFDLLTGRLDFLEPDAVNQLYDVGNLWRDTRVAVREKLDLLNLVTEPIPLREIARDHFGIELGPGRAGEAPRYDVRTRHADRFGVTGPYLRDALSVHHDLAEFVRAERARNRPENTS